MLYSSNPQFKSNQISSLPQFKPLPIPATFFPSIHHSGQPHIPSILHSASKPILFTNLSHLSLSFLPQD